jgi:hypothetical protein
MIIGQVNEQKVNRIDDELPPAQAFAKLKTITCC